jgi:hypothetical protein
MLNLVNVRDIAGHSDGVASHCLDLQGKGIKIAGGARGYSDIGSSLR